MPVAIQLDAMVNVAIMSLDFNFFAMLQQIGDSLVCPFLPLALLA